MQEGDDSHDDWRNLKQVSDTADEDMEDQLDYLFRMAELGLEACEEGYGKDEEKLEKCEKKETRKMCYRFESMSQLCDSTLEQVSCLRRLRNFLCFHIVFDCDVSLTLLKSSVLFSPL